MKTIVMSNTPWSMLLRFSLSIVICTFFNVVFIL